MPENSRHIFSTEVSQEVQRAMIEPGLTVVTSFVFILRPAAEPPPPLHATLLG